jgi:hypothetical protein
MITNWLDKFMGWMSDKLSWLPKLGGGIKWYVKGKVIELWPFVALALCILVLWLVDIIGRVG